MRKNPPVILSDSARNQSAMVVSIAGFFVMLVTIAAGIWRWTGPEHVALVLAPVTGVVGAVAGAFLGFQLGAAGIERADLARQQAETARQEAQTLAMTLAAVADPRQAEPILRALASGSVVQPAGD
jgi:hypothetical protein